MATGNTDRFCPLIGNGCKGQSCVLWVGDGCVLPAIAQQLLRVPTQVRTDVVFEDGEDDEAPDPAVRSLVAFLERDASNQRELLLALARPEFESGRASWKDYDSVLEEFIESQAFEPYGLPQDLEQKWKAFQREAKQWLSDYHLQTVQSVLAQRERLLSELVQFGIGRFDQVGHSGVPGNTEAFWDPRGVRHLYSAPRAVQQAVEGIEAEADQELDEQIKQLTQKRLEEEIRSVARIRDECVQWVVKQRVRKVAIADIETFVKLKGMRFSREAIRVLKRKVEVELGY
jgi:hypothetical protein